MKKNKTKLWQLLLKMAWGSFRMFFAFALCAVIDEELFIKQLKEDKSFLEKIKNITQEFSQKLDEYL